VYIPFVALNKNVDFALLISILDHLFINLALVPKEK